MQTDLQEATQNAGLHGQAWFGDKPHVYWASIWEDIHTHTGNLWDGSVEHTVHSTWAYTIVSQECPPSPFGPISHIGSKFTLMSACFAWLMGFWEAHPRVWNINCGKNFAYIYQQLLQVSFVMANVVALAIYTMITVACCHLECCMHTGFDLWRWFHILLFLSNNFAVRKSQEIESGGYSSLAKCSKKVPIPFGRLIRCSAYQSSRKSAKKKMHQEKLLQLLSGTCISH